MAFYEYYYLNRTMCDVLEEMRKCHKTRNYSNLLSLVEEVQSMGNRMESKLGEIKDFKKLKEDFKELQEKSRKLDEEYKEKGGKEDAE